MLRAAATITFLVLAAVVTPGPVFAADTGSDTIGLLGGKNPLCGKAIGARGASYCKSSGAPEHKYPLDHYRFDSNIKTGVTRVNSNIMAAVQSAMAIIWTILLYMVKGVLLVFQWAFSLDLLGTGLGVGSGSGELRSGGGSSIATALSRVNRVLGSPFMIPIILALGLWGIWSGLVRQKTAYTIGSLALAIFLLAASLYVIHNPGRSIGQFNSISNRIALDSLSTITTGSSQSSRRSLAQSSQGIFHSVVYRPWCALQFGSVTWCEERAAGSGSLTNGSFFLQHAPSSPERKRAVKAYTGIGAKLNEVLSDKNSDIFNDEQRRAAALFKSKTNLKYGDMMQEDHTMQRMGVLALSAVLLVCTALVIFWIALRVLFLGAMALVLLLALPVIMIVGVFPGRGHQLFKAWALKLGGAILGKGIYAILLATVLAVAGAISSLEDVLPWLAVALAQIAFFWGLFLFRKSLMSFSFAGAGGASSDKSPGAKAAGTVNRAKGRMKAAVGLGAMGGFIAGKKALKNRKAQKQEVEQGKAKAGARRALSDKARQGLNRRHLQNKKKLAADAEARNKIGQIKAALSDPSRNLSQQEKERRRNQLQSLRKDVLPDQRRQALAGEVAQVEGRRGAGRAPHTAAQVDGQVGKMAEAARGGKPAGIDRELATQRRLLVQSGRVAPADRKELKAANAGRLAAGGSASQRKPMARNTQARKDGQQGRKAELLRRRESSQRRRARSRVTH